MFFALYLIIAVVAAFIMFRSKASSDNPNKSNLNTLVWTIATFIGVLFILNVQPIKVERVDAGNVGIKVEMVGDARGIGKYEYKTGWVFYNSFSSKVYEFPTFQQHIDYPEQIVITRGGFQCTIKPSFNYSLKAGEVGDMFSNLRLPISQIEQRWLQTAIVGTVNDVANRWSVDSLFNHRQDFESNIVVEVNKKISRWFIVSQLRTNIVPPDALRNSIEAKTRAVQEVQVAENQKNVKIAEGLMHIAEAKADSAVAVTRAAGEARAIRERQLSLTPMYIQYMKITKWDGRLPTTSLGSGTGIMLNQSND